MSRVKQNIEDFHVPLDENWNLVSGQDDAEWVAERKEYKQQTRWRNLKAKCFLVKIFEGNDDLIKLMMWTARAMIALEGTGKFYPYSKRLKRN